MDAQVIQQQSDRRPNRTQTEKVVSAGMAGVVCFVVCTILLHLIQPELSPINDAISYYMNGRCGWVLGLGLISLGVGSLAILLGLRGLGWATKARAGSLALALWGVGAIIGGIFPPDPRGHWDQPPSVPGMIHAGAAMIAFIAFPVAALLLSQRIGQVSGSPGMTNCLQTLAVLSALSLVIFFGCLAPVFADRAPYALGLVERILLAVYVAWLCAALLSVRRAALRLTEQAMRSVKAAV